MKYCSGDVLWTHHNIEKVTEENIDKICFSIVAIFQTPVSQNRF